jgi:NTE family protein
MAKVWQWRTTVDAVRPRWSAALLASAALLLAGGPAAGQSPESGATPTRPRVALVLSGGGARGFAHVGVLRALKEMHVPVDIVAGASMGSVVGGAYAAGRSVEELEDFVRGTDWTGLLADRPPRDALTFRRREDDLLVPSHIEFGIGRAGVQLPPGTVGNAVLEDALTRLLPSGASDLPVDRLALPFRCVASDLLTGALVELHDSPLFLSMRASLAMPGVFAPIRVNGRLLVDGGLVRNLPVNIARAMGAEVIIAVNVGTPLAGEEELGSSIGVARQMLQILTEQNVQRSLQALAPGDVLISPELDGISFMNFGLSERAMAAGERAARQLAGRLQALAVSPEAYAAIERARVTAMAGADSARPIARLEVRATPHAGSAALAAQFGLHEGDNVTTAQVKQAAAPLLGGGDFERIEVDVRDVDGQRQVTLTPVEAGWARSRVRLGLELSSDFSDDNQFTVSALHLLSWLNAWGGEVRTLARVGSVRSLVVQPWQPLAPGSLWHLVPSVQYRASSLDVYEDRVRTQRVGYEVTIGTLAFGRQLANWGNVQFGVDRRVGRARTLLVTDGTQTVARLRETARYAQFQIDTLDSLVLPSRGLLLQGRVERIPARSGEAGRGSASWVGMQAFRVGHWASHVYAEWSRSRSGLAPLSLGGFLRLSGTPRESVEARELVLGRLTMARRIGDVPPGLGGAVRAGFSIELGGGYDRDKAVDRGEWQRAGSVFMSVDTRFGPAFLALGSTRHVGSAIYLFLGPFW